jgi:tRNA 2-thiouridine synthesizing protein A
MLLYAIPSSRDSFRAMPDVTMIDFDLEVDASGLLCPLPLLRLKKALMEVQSGDVIKIIATDPAAHLDIGVYVDQCGHQILEFTRTENVQVFFIRKKIQSRSPD